MPLGEQLADLVEPGSVGCDCFEIVPTPIADARVRPDAASLSKAGFELLRHREALALPAPADFERADACKRWLCDELLPKTSELVRSAVQRSYGKDVIAVHAVDHTLQTVDSLGNDRRNNLVMEAHADFTCESVTRHLQGEHALFKLGDERPIDAIEGVTLLVNLWQPLVETVRRAPIAVCDVDSSHSDLVCRTAHSDGHPSEEEVSYVLQNDKQEWWYYKHMRKDEALVFLAWGPDGRMTAHSTVVDTTDRKDEPPRCSVEVCFAVKLAGGAAESAVEPQTKKPRCA